jgi:hypothetical protein
MGLALIGISAFSLVAFSLTSDVKGDVPHLLTFKFLFDSAPYPSRVSY